MVGIAQSEITKIQRLVGPVEQEQLIHVDCFAGENVGVFMPVTGPCYYAVSPRHTHPSYMFTIAFNDRTALKIGEDTIQSPQGKILALSPGIPHHEVHSGQHPGYVAILIEKEFFQEQLLAYPVTQNIVFRGAVYECLPALLSRLKEFMIEIDNKMPGSEIIVKALSVELCHLIIRSIFNINCKRDRIKYRFEIDKTIDYMHSNLWRKISVERLAGIANMSPSYYARIFKRETGLTPINYLNNISYAVTGKQHQFHNNKNGCEGQNFSMNLENRSPVVSK
ncbi:MAG: DNA-binding transcriptional regulator AraC [Pelotomaculum sp. PtaB.Bin013]|uniref:AraC family transcriptional regulator n=1 Tax=Pelotomaculum isophthalicicum JI TaxID=947010 RepID=A0A9X4GZ86_9FIRM|nr:helix-turn-helix domain-containing protein [Pelotomaculum isophthalicicum]MDF9408495.1 AraC family transcriptional regulator [Pelotomaculum isophthalicicum JI]OPX89625.1 MAG: DNA-binding transcriptional regulator AraC [Pelotomaculum sp. PtaB.Bin013]